MKHKIAFIGAGTMGSGMIKNLVEAGFEVNFYNRTPKEIPGAAYKSLEDLEGEVYIICVSNDEAVRECFEKLNLKEGAIFADCGTTSLELTEELQKKCDEKGVKFLDAPITGSRLGAESGNLTFMVGGDKDAFDALEEEFDVMGKKAVYCGGNGAGQKVKHALNLTQSNILQGYLEGIALALKHGVGLKEIVEVMENAAAKNGVGSFKMPYIEKEDYDPHFLLKLMHKDLKLAGKEMGELGLDLPLSKKTIEIFNEAMNLEMGDLDFSSIAKIIEDKNGVKFRD